MNDSLLSLMSLCVYIYVIAIVNSILKLLQVITAQAHLLVYYYCFSAVLVTTKSMLLIGEKKRTREEREQRRQTRGEGRTLTPLHNTYVYSISSELMIIREASDDTERKR